MRHKYHHRGQNHGQSWMSWAQVGTIIATVIGMGGGMMYRFEKDVDRLDRNMEIHSQRFDKINERIDETIKLIYELLKKDK